MEEHGTLHIQVLLEEYRALYSLLVFRLGAMEQRVPVLTALLSALLGGSSIVPIEGRPLVFLALPIALLRVVHSTLVHTQAKQDVKLRLDEIERAVNQRAGALLMTFQSHHPSRGAAVAGRTGRDLVVSVHLATIGLLGGCVLLFPTSGLPLNLRSEFIGYVAICALWATINVVRASTYRKKIRVVSTDTV